MRWKNRRQLADDTWELAEKCYELFPLLVDEYSLRESPIGIGDVVILKEPGKGLQPAGGWLVVGLRSGAWGDTYDLDEARAQLEWLRKDGSLGVSGGPDVEVSRLRKVDKFSGQLPNDLSKKVEQRRIDRDNLLAEIEALQRSWCELKRKIYGKQRRTKDGREDN